MNDHSDDGAISKDREKAGDYEPPRVCESVRFETLALSCSQMEGDPNCGLGPFTGAS